MYGPGTGIGPALRKARVSRGKTIEEASRDTRIRPEYLQAMEREAFQTLRGDVYVRGFLRSYSSYLGLNPDKVVSVYVRSTGRTVDDVPEPPPVRPLQQPALQKVMHRRGNWKLALAIAMIGLAAAGAAGVLSRGGSAPAPAAQGASPGVAAPVATDTVTLVIAPRRPVQAVVVVDGQERFSGMLQAGKRRSFEGAGLIRVELAKGGAADLTVNGAFLKAPGDPKTPYAASFQPRDFRSTP